MAITNSGSRKKKYYYNYYYYFQEGPNDQGRVLLIREFKT